MISLRQLCRQMFCATLLCVGLLTTSQAANIDLFPVEYTNAGGQTTWGYMNDRGQLEIDYTFATAEVFDPNGFATVTNQAGETALLLATGEQCTDWLPDIVTVEYAGNYAALRTATATTYYDNTGKHVATLEGAVGFPSNDRVCVYRQPELPAVPEQEQPEVQPLSAASAEKAYGYVTLTDETVIAPQYVQAGSFRDGRALVQTADGIYHQIDVEGNAVATLPAGAKPASLDIYTANLVILQGAQQQYAVYSLSEQAFTTPYIYDTILPFADGVAQVQQNGLWGLLATDGSLSLAPTYPYLNAMGEGMYAVRGTDGTVSTINAVGDVVYQTETYVGGFDSFRYGLAWHGTMEGTVEVYNAAGTMTLSFENADRAQIVSQVVIRLEEGDSARYVDIFGKKTLYQAVREYQLDNDLCVTSNTYTKWLGMREDGSDYGWDIVYPVVRGFADPAVEQLVNDGIRDFFLAGPTTVQTNTPVSATYGFSVEGEVLVVWAVGTLGEGETTVPWNDSIGIDLQTGQVYRVMPDLLDETYFTGLKDLLPAGETYGYPRMQTDGITWYCNYNASQTGKPYSEQVFLSFDEMAKMVRYTDACYQQLTGVDVPSYADIDQSHWAFPAVSNTTAQGYLSGTEQGFLPDAPIEQRDVVVAMARLLGKQACPDPVQPYTQPAYADAVLALYNASILETKSIQPMASIDRLQLMQLLSAMYTYEKQPAPTLEEAQALLAPYADASDLTNPADCIAVAHCLQQGIIRGSEGKLQLEQTVTRAMFAQVAWSWTLMQ